MTPADPRAAAMEKLQLLADSDLTLPHCDKCDGDGYSHSPECIRVTAREVLALLALPVAETGCEWHEDEDGNWDTACGEMFTFIVDGPKENWVKFCCYCGAKMTPVAYAAPPEPPEGETT